MKRILIFLSVVSLLSVSCVPMSDDKAFDQSAAERIQESMDEYRQVLIDNEAGWLMEYYPGPSPDYFGGFNAYFKFIDENNVAIGVPEVGGTTLAESLYQIKGDAGPTVNFNSYNDNFNYFSDPSLQVGSGEGYGFRGDYEFVIMSAEPDEVLLRGKKTGNLMRLTPFTGDWESFSADVVEIYELAKAPIYVLEAGGETFETTRSNNVFTFTDAEENVDVPFIFTETGLKFHEPVELGGQKMQVFIFDPDTNVYNAVGADATITLVLPPVNEAFANTTALWAMGDMSAAMQSLFDAAAGTVALDGEIMGTTLIGRNPFTTNSPTFPEDETSFRHLMIFESSGYITGYSFEFTPVADTEDECEVIGDVTNGLHNWTWPTYAAAFGPIVEFISDNSPYVLVADNPRNPTAITFTSIADSSVSFTISQ